MSKSLIECFSMVLDIALLAHKQYINGSYNNIN
jgi:hypothetical protein